MKRTQLAALGIALAAVVAGAIALAPSAAAAEWHVYEGDIHPGHAYGLLVPAGARSYEIALDGAEGASASVTLLDPAGEKLGHYALTAAAATVAVVTPVEGRHVLYVYDVAGGALQVRVDAEEAPALSLQPLPLVREDAEVASGDGGPLVRTMTATLRSEPVFLTLLYEGSVRGLDATIASAGGDAVTIADETGTAFSPGVWSSLTGSRSTDAARIDGATYQVTATADAFEGTMTLATLAIDLASPPVEVPTEPPVPPQRPGELPLHETPAHAPVVHLAEARAFELTLAAGTLEILDPHAIAAEDEDRSDLPDRAAFAVSIRSPDDELVAYIDEPGDQLAYAVEIPEDGAYVAYVHHASSGLLLARQASGAPIAMRELQLATEVVELELAGLSPFFGEVRFDLANVPVAMDLFVSNGVSAFGHLAVENEKGVVAERSETVRTPFFDDSWGAALYPESFMSGEHRLWTSGHFTGRVTIVSVSYLRDTVAPVEPVHEDGAHEHDDASHDEGHDGSHGDGSHESHEHEGETAEGEEHEAEEPADEEPADEDEGWFPFPF